MKKGREEERSLERWDPERKPTLGGITLYMVFLLCFSLSYGPYFDGSEAEQIRMMGLLGAASLAFLMGLSDDVYHTRPLLKLGVQAACGAILLFSGTGMGMPGPDWLGPSFTLLWVILLMNSFNMIDNMDGIAGGIALTVVLASLYRLWILDEELLSLWPVLIGMAAGILGFLRYNVHPSSMFLGDAGTQFLGLILAYLSLRLFWMSGDISGTPFGWTFLLKALSIPLLFWSTIADTLTVFVLRIHRGTSPTKGGKDHSTHAFSYAGWPERGVNLFYFLWSTLNVLLASYVIMVDRSSAFLGTLLLLAYFAISFLGLLVHTYRRNEKPVTE